MFANAFTALCESTLLPLLLHVLLALGTAPHSAALAPPVGGYFHGPPPTWRVFLISSRIVRKPRAMYVLFHFRTVLLELRQLEL